MEERNVKLIPDTLIEKAKKSPRVCAIDMQEARTRLAKAEKAMASKDPQTAERLLIQALTLQPESAAIRIALAQMYMETCREPKAEALYRELLQEKDSAEWHSQLGLSLFRQQKFAEASDAYRAALSLEPENAECAVHCARACMQAKNFTDAVQFLEQAVAAQTRNVKLLHLLAECYERMNDEESAYKTYKRITRIDPRDQVIQAKLKVMAAEMITA